MDSHNWFQLPWVAALVDALLLGVATVAGIAIRETLDSGALGNFVYFCVVVATHFGVLSCLGILVGYGGGMIAATPSPKFGERWRWWLGGDAALNRNQGFI